MKLKLIILMRFSGLNRLLISAGRSILVPALKYLAIAPFVVRGL